MIIFKNNRFFKKFVLKKWLYLKQLFFKTLVFKMIVFQNDRFYKIRRLLTIFNNDPTLTIANNDPFINEERKPT